jgi:AmmeMemoRadiSam system protein A
MMPEKLSEEDRTYLLKLARKAIEAAVRGENLPEIDWETLSPALHENGASFVTLTEDGSLRGCIGALEAYQPLAEDVREHAVAAALEDYRFYPVRAPELSRLEIEISRLTAPVDLPYEKPEDLLRLLRPGVDGVILMDGRRRATFLPQVWEKVPNSGEFLSELCLKMGAPEDLWRKKLLTVRTYQVEEFHE